MDAQQAAASLAKLKQLGLSTAVTDVIWETWSRDLGLQLLSYDDMSKWLLDPIEGTEAIRTFVNAEVPRPVVGAFASALRTLRGEAMCTRPGENRKREHGPRHVPPRPRADAETSDVLYAPWHPEGPPLLANSLNELFKECDESFETFEEMGLRQEVLRGIYAYGFEAPSNTQSKGTVPFTKGQNIVLQAMRDAGRTSTFCAGVLNALDYGLDECQALVMAPTHDVVQQVEEIMRALGDFLQVKCHACVGGTSVREDARILGGSSVHVVVGTPGRVLDMLRRKALRAKNIKMFVLDEADSFGKSKDQISDIFGYLPLVLQVGVVTATMSAEVLELVRKFVKEPVHVTVMPALEGIEQVYVKVAKKRKLDALHELLDIRPMAQRVIFANTRSKVDWLADRLRGRLGVTVSATHGDMDTNDRAVLLREFRSGSSHILVTTDHTSHIVDASEVINYDMPTQPGTYRRRLAVSLRGRDQKRLVISLVGKGEVRMLQEVQESLKIVVEEMRPALTSLKGW